MRDARAARPASVSTIKGQAAGEARTADVLEEWRFGSRRGSHGEQAMAIRNLGSGGGLRIERCRVGCRLASTGRSWSAMGSGLRANAKDAGWGSRESDLGSNSCGRLCRG